MLKVSTTDEDIAESDTKTSITVAEVTERLMDQGNTLYIFDRAGLFYEEITLDTDQQEGDTTLSIESHTFSHDFPTGAWIIYDIKNMLRQWILARGRWVDQGFWKDRDQWKDE